MPGEGRHGAVRAFPLHYTCKPWGIVPGVRRVSFDDRGPLSKMASPGEAISRPSTKARIGGDPLGWLVRGAALSATFAAVIWLSRPIAQTPGLAAFSSAPDPASDDLMAQPPQSATLSQDHWEAWLAARQRVQAAIAEYAAIADQTQWFLRQHVAVLRDARRCGSSLLARRSSAAAASGATDTAETIRPPHSEAERRRWAFLKGDLARLEAERARLLATHTPAHPEVARLDGVMVELRNEIRQLEQWLGNQGEFAPDGSGQESSRSVAAPLPPHQERLVTADSRPPVGNGDSRQLPNELPVEGEETEAFREAMRDLAAGEATLSQLLEQAGPARQELVSALRQEQASAAALREAWCDSAERAVVATRPSGRSNPPASASIARSRSDWGLRGTLAAALSVLSAIAAGWIWSGLRDTGQKPHAEPSPRRYWRADGAEPPPRPKFQPR